MTDRVVPVAAAVITRPDGSVLLAQRPPGKAYAGYWEFPGGKLEAGESPRRALDRELEEELGLKVRRAAPWLTQRFVYPHAHVELHFFRVFEWEGEPVGHDGQAFAWQTPGAFDVAPLLPANTLVLRALTLPVVCGITMASDLGEAAFLERARAALDAGLKLIQVREKDWPETRQRAFVDSILDLARPHGARVLAERQRGLGARVGVRRRSLDIRGARDRCGAARRISCARRHVTPERTSRRPARCGSTSRCSVRCCRRRRIRARSPLGWDGFATLTEGAALPIFALGGLSASDLDTAIAHGAHGIALRRAAWTN